MRATGRAPSMDKAAAGDNPVATKRREATRNAANTVKAAVDRYLAECDRNLKPKTAREWRRIFEHDVLPRWGERPIGRDHQGRRAGAGQRQGAHARAQAQGTSGGRRGAGRKTLTRLRTFFGWAVANDLVTPIRPPVCASRRKKRRAIAF